MIQTILQHLQSLAMPMSAGVAGVAVWLRMRGRDRADAQKAVSEAKKIAADAVATDAEVGRRLREELRAEIAVLRRELHEQDEECRRRLTAMEAALGDAQRVIKANGRTIAAQAGTILELERKVSDLSGEPVQTHRGRRR